MDVIKTLGGIHFSLLHASRIGAQQSCKCLPSAVAKQKGEQSVQTEATTTWLCFSLDIITPQRDSTLTSQLSKIT